METLSVYAAVVLVMGLGFAAGTHLAVNKPYPLPRELTSFLTSTRKASLVAAAVAGAVLLVVFLLTGIWPFS